MRQPAFAPAANSSDPASHVSAGSGCRAVTVHTPSSTHTIPAAVTATSASSQAVRSHPNVPFSLPRHRQPIRRALSSDPARTLVPVPLAVFSAHCRMKLPAVEEVVTQPLISTVDAEPPFTPTLAVPLEIAPEFPDAGGVPPMW